ncbi:MAG: hypothetical protein Q7U14_01820 [Lacisediminimonas sp.]|nr:hypothetical protein [Lacisediminimonas sp.]
MKPGLSKVLLIVASAGAALFATSALAISEEELRVLDQQCEQARSAALAPIREKLARECEQSRPNSPDPRKECETELSTYGNSRSGARGSVVRGMFYDLPECKQAQAAWEEWDKSRPWR